MCEIGKKIKFCTCLGEEDVTRITLSKRLDSFLEDTLPNSMEPFTWILYKYLGTEESEAMGLLNLPSESIGGELTNEYVLSQINNENCFDFNYDPLEGDNLEINFQRNKYWTEFLSFIYRNEKWEADSYNTFTENIEATNYGKLKVEK